MSRKYVAHSKHGGAGGARGVKGSPMDLSDGDAQTLLNDAAHCFEEPGKRQFVGAKSGKFYVYQDDNAGGFHGYRVSGAELCAKYPKAAKRIGELLKVDFKRLQKMA
jgi:hypothetical protein